MMEGSRTYSKKCMELNGNPSLRLQEYGVLQLEVFNFIGVGSVALAMYNINETIFAFAEASMNTTYQKSWPLLLSTKHTILKKYDGRTYSKKCMELIGNSSLRLQEYGMSTVLLMIWYFIRLKVKMVMYGLERIMMEMCRVISWLKARSLLEHRGVYRCCCRRIKGKTSEEIYVVDPCSIPDCGLNCQ